MRVYLVRFCSYAGPTSHQYLYRTEAEGRGAFAKGMADFPGGVLNKDSFGIEIYLHPVWTIVLTDTEKSVAFQVALTQANEEAAKTYGVRPQATAMPEGSSLQ